MTKKELLVWAAGFVDGEGHFAFYPSKSKKGFRWKLAFSVAQNEREPLDRLFSVLGVGNINGPYKYKNGTKHYIYRCGSSYGVEDILNLIGPYLCKRRKRQGERAIRMFQSRVIRRPRRKMRSKSR